MPAWVAPVVGGVISAVGGFLGQERTNRQNRGMAREQMAFQERMSNTQWQRAVEDMRSAGINPALAYQQGPATAPGGQTAVMGDSVSSALQAMQMRKGIQLLEQQVEKATAEATTAKAQSRLDKYRSRILLPEGKVTDHRGRGVIPLIEELVDLEVKSARGGAANIGAQAKRNEALANILGVPSQLTGRLANPAISRIIDALFAGPQGSGKGFMDYWSQRGDYKALMERARRERRNR